ncbi:MAG: hypothetical protein OXK82_05550 [Deltaproteobacteria bacterium]|nr:hypothetical protein [Deltaproteobacteria bacterium]
MTDEEMDKTAAETLLEHSKTQKRIACLRKRIEPFGECFRELGRKLGNEPEAIAASRNEGAFRFQWSEMDRIRRSKTTTAEFNPVEIMQHLQDLQREMKQLNRLKMSLREMGHGHVLKE